MTRYRNHDDDFEIVNGKPILRDGARMVVRTLLMDARTVHDRGQCGSAMPPVAVI
jgi:hypothetical protein